LGCESGNDEVQNKNYSACIEVETTSTEAVTEPKIEDSTRASFLDCLRALNCVKTFDI